MSEDLPGYRTVDAAKSAAAAVLASKGKPVDTDALRTWAAARADGKLFPMVLAAADEVDRLRDDVALFRRIGGRLRAVIENAPHGRYCALTFRPQPKRMNNKCTCWKADAL